MVTNLLYKSFWGLRKKIESCRELGTGVGEKKVALPGGKVRSLGLCDLSLGKKRRKKGYVQKERQFSISEV